MPSIEAVFEEVHIWRLKQPLAGTVAQLEERLPNTHKACTCINNQGMMAHGYNPRTREVETGG